MHGRIRREDWIAGGQLHGATLRRVEQAAIGEPLRSASRLSPLEVAIGRDDYDAFLGFPALPIPALHRGYRTAWRHAQLVDGRVQIVAAVGNQAACRRKHCKRMRFGSTTHRTSDRIDQLAARSPRSAAQCRSDIVRDLFAVLVAPLHDVRLGTISANEQKPTTIRRPDRSSEYRGAWNHIEQLELRIEHGDDHLPRVGSGRDG